MAVKSDFPTRTTQALEHLAYGHGSTGMQVMGWPTADDHTDDCPGCRAVKLQASRVKLAEQDKAKADAAAAEAAVKAAKEAQDKAVANQKKLTAAAPMPSSVTGMPPEPPKDKK